MNLLLLEHITASFGKSYGAPSAGLLEEGSLMLQWLVASRAADPSHTRVLIHPDWSELASPLPWMAYSPEAWQRQLQWADAVLAVAPETDGVLLGLAEEVISAGVTWLGCLPAAIEVASSKWRTCQALQAADVATIPCFQIKQTRHSLTGVSGASIHESNLTRQINSEAGLTSFKNGWVTKPDDGCGCEGQQRHDTLDAALAHLHLHPHLLLQPWLEGTPKSLSLLFDKNGQFDCLSVNHQYLSFSAMGEPRLSSLQVDAEPQTHAHQHLAEGVARALPGLYGLVGIDFIDSCTGPVVLEVNPRMTSSMTQLPPFSPWK